MGDTGTDKYTTASRSNPEEDASIQANEVQDALNRLKKWKTSWIA